MGDKDHSQPLLGDPTTQQLPPLPAYQPMEAESLSAAKPPSFAKATTFPAMTLPTYDQSEKFVKDGVHTGPPMEEEEETEPLSQGESFYRGGTFGEFVIFFIVCALLGVAGFVFSFCFATSVAAQSGAIAGLGTAFITWPVAHEFYYKNYESHWSDNWCSGYSSSSEADALKSCLNRTTIGIRLLFFTMGLIGLVLLYKGFSGYFRSLPSSNRNN